MNIAGDAGSAVLERFRLPVDQVIPPGLKRDLGWNLRRPGAVEEPVA